MQILLLLVISSFVIVGIVALYLHVAGFSKCSQIPNTSEGIRAAKHKIQSSYPNSTITDFIVTPSHTIALALFQDGNGSILQAMGRYWILHPLNHKSVKRIEVITNLKKGSGLRISFNDYTAPSLKLFLGNEEALQIWRAMLQPFVQYSIKGTK